MLPRKNSLKLQTEIDEVFRRGKLWQSPSFSAKFRVREGEPPLMRVAFSFGKKHLKRAVDRNVLKRRLTEALQDYAAEAPEAVDIVFFLQKTGNIPDIQTLEGEVAHFVSKLYNTFK